MMVLVSILSCLLLCVSYSPSVSNAQKTLGDVSRFDMRSSKALVLDSEMCVVVKKCSISVNTIFQTVAEMDERNESRAPESDQQSTYTSKTSEQLSGVLLDIGTSLDGEDIDDTTQNYITDIRVSDRQSTDSGQAPDGDQQSTDSVQAPDGLLVLSPELLTGLQEITTSAPPPEEPGMGAMLGATPELLRNS